MKLLFAPHSPYSSKVRMAARYLGISPGRVRGQHRGENPPELIVNNPLGKIPTLLTDKYEAIFDSRAIMHFLHRTAEKVSIRKTRTKRTDAKFWRLSATASAMPAGHVYERRFRPPELVSQDVIDRNGPRSTEPRTSGQETCRRLARSCTVAISRSPQCIGYLHAALPGEWEKGRAALAEWPATFAKHSEPIRLAPEGLSNRPKAAQ